MCVFGVKITANQAFLIFSSLHFCFLVLFACPFSTFSQSSGTLDSLHPISLEYIISHQTQVALPLKCLQNLTLSSKFHRSHSCGPVLHGSSLLSPALSAGDEYDSGMSNGTARIQFPRTQSPSSPQEHRERSVQKSPEDPAARGASNFLTLNKDKRASRAASIQRR